MPVKKVGWRDLAKGVRYMVPPLLDIQRGNLLRLAGLRPASKQSIGKVIEYWARRTPHNIALRFEDQQWTYAQFNAWANRLAACWAEQGVGPGDTVAIMMENRPEALACVAATVKLGAIAGMLNHNQSGEVLEHSIQLVTPRLLVVSAECAAALATTCFTPVASAPNTAQPAPSICYLWHGGDQGEPAPPGWLDLDEYAARQSQANPPGTGRVRAEQPCFSIFTSGTTGLPKASVMTHYRWLAAMAGVGGMTLGIRRKDVFYCCLPLYHNNALTVAWGSVLSMGASLALDRKFSASQFWERVRHYDATVFCYIGELLRYLLNVKPCPTDRQHRIRLITGNGLRPEIWDQFEQRFGIHRIYEFYGASESNIGFINLFGVSQTAGFTPLPFAIVEFDNDTETPRRNHNGFMQRIPRGGIGLLISEVTPRRPFDGYTDPAAGEKKLLRDVFKKGDCWFNSGDLVRDQGLHHIQFVDRVGDTFRWKGENVAAGEVEGAMAQHPDIDHGVVYGVSIPGCDGRAGMAAVTLSPGVTLNGPGLAQHLNRLLPAYAVPLFLRIRDHQETTGTFKYRKVELKQQGFAPDQVAEPVYVLLDSQRGYQPLTAELARQIQQGEIRL
ncbi:long-chain-acyl-CoA synthetase [Alcanivorax sp. IL3]|uniref:long-chain-acyl-CoA synthetase n=1 Tax=unclassified Alcanivorax TaxID=2638842 RepID=UPI0039C00B26